MANTLHGHQMDKETMQPSATPPVSPRTVNGEVDIHSVSPLPHSSPQILVVPRRKVGDLILATPMIAALGSAFPDCRIDVCVNDYNAPVVNGHPMIRTRHIVQRPEFGRTAARRYASPLISLLHVWKMRQQRYDLMIYCDANPRRGALRLLRAVQPRRSVCCVSRLLGRQFGVDTILSPEDFQDLHAVERNLAILRAIGIRVDAPPPLFLPAASEPNDDDGPAFDHYQDRPVAVHVSMPLRKKRWPHTHFVRLIEHIRAVHGRSVLVVVDPRDSFDQQSSIATCGPPCALISPKNFVELVAQLRRCSVVVAHDSAIVHIAAALGKPTLGIYVEENVRGYYPWNIPHVILTGKNSAAEISVQSACEGFDRVQDNEGRSPS